MKIICIGRNYAAHAKELKNEIPAEPIFFIKPDSAILPKKIPLFYPDFTKDLHYEVEIIVRINRLGKNIAEKFAHKYYQDIGLGVDFTARDIQQECKEKGLPWEKAKAFDGSAVIGEFVDKKQFQDIHQLNFSLKKNGQVVQQGNTQNMLFNIDQLIAHVSKYFTLKIGDILFTGTPEGVGPVQTNDVLEATLEGKKLLQVKIK